MYVQVLVTGVAAFLLEGELFCPLAVRGDGGSPHWSDAGPLLQLHGESEYGCIHKHVEIHCEMSLSRI